MRAQRDTKVAVDLTNQRQTDIDRAVGMITRARTRQTDMSAEIEVLKEEVSVLREELEKRDQPQAREDLQR